MVMELVGVITIRLDTALNLEVQAEPVLAQPHLPARMEEVLSSVLELVAEVQVVVV